MKVLKFGGSSVANAQSLASVLSVVAINAKKHRIVVVVSAISGITDLLIKAGREAEKQDICFRETVQNIEFRFLEFTRSILPVTIQSAALSMVKQSINEIEDVCSSIYTLKEMSDRTCDKLVSYGEIITSRVISEKMTVEEIGHQWIDSRTIIRTDNHFGKANVNLPVTNKSVRSEFQSEKYKVFLLPGFIASDPEGNTTTLGRGGSDYTAAIIGAALNASCVEIWTDVSGMMTADPRQVKNARPIPEISYLEAMELSHFGAKVLYPPVIRPTMLKKIPLLIKNTFAPDEQGTLITDKEEASDNIRGISSISGIVLLRLEGPGMIGIPGFSKRLFAALAAEGISVVLITQASSEFSICVAISEADETKAIRVVSESFRTELTDGSLLPVKAEGELAIIALVGNSMVNLPGISGRMFGVLGRNGVNIRAIAQGSSERNISAVIAKQDLKKSLNALHEEFFESVYKQINLFVTGVGNVGGKLMDQIKRQSAYLEEHLRLQIRLIGVANSRKMHFEEDGIDWNEWKDKLNSGEPMSNERFVAKTISLNKRNSIFIDNTDSSLVAELYDAFLRKSISVVTCNKIACSSHYDTYKKLKRLTHKHNAQFLFETNVGAGLPVINTLNDLLRSGDRVRRIESVLSGTMNFVFNHYDGTKSFAEVVRMAQNEGYTEPDPRVDLCGKDVMRKILILAREAGRKIEMDEITNEGFLPDSCLQGDIEQFYAELEKHEDYFRGLYLKAHSENRRLKFIARMDEDSVSVGLEAVPEESDFYNLGGKDNAVLFYTECYPDYPLVVKGAGAGAAVTASGLFSDIIRAARIS